MFAGGTVWFSGFGGLVTEEDGLRRGPTPATHPAAVLTAMEQLEGAAHYAIREG